MLKYTDITGAVVDKVQTAIDRLRAFEPPDGYYVAFSGGKDSQCIYHLCKRAGVKFDAHYRVTSVDPPELVRFIREQYPDVEFEFPRDADGNVITMWNLIPRKKMPPTRLARYCCEVLKEAGGRGRIAVTGVRWAESVNRAAKRGLVNINGAATKRKAVNNGATHKASRYGVMLNYDDDASRRTVEQCFRTSKTLLNPIIDWELEDVWEYLNGVERVPHCELYDRGFERLGCIGCPMANGDRELRAWPKYEANYIRAFDRMLEERKKAGLVTTFKDGRDVLNWWTGRVGGVRGEEEGQISIWE